MCILQTSRPILVKMEAYIQQSEFAVHVRGALPSTEYRYIAVDIRDFRGCQRHKCVRKYVRTDSLVVSDTMEEHPQIKKSPVNVYGAGIPRAHDECPPSGWSALVSTAYYYQGSIV